MDLPREVVNDIATPLAAPTKHVKYTAAEGSIIYDCLHKSVILAVYVVNQGRSSYTTRRVTVKECITQ